MNSMMTRIFRTLAAAGLGCCAAFSQSVVTGNYDTSRTNANLAETQLVPASVRASSFGKLFSLSVDGQIYAQPLYLPNASIPGSGKHNVVFAATMHNTLYAFDADAPSTPLWSVNLGPSVPTANYQSDIGLYTDILPENGILSTPVIDPATGTLYAVAATFEDGSYYYRLHALDITSGAERFGAPAVITARVAGIGEGSVSAALPFDASMHLQRPALLLLNGVIYIAFGSHGDAPPFHGWMFGYSALNVQNQVSVLNTSPNGGGASFWQAGRGPAADADGNILAVTSNGDTDEVSAFGDNVLKLDPNTLAVRDWFAPFNFQVLDDTDNDLGTTGMLLIDGSNYMVTGGKQGVFYLLDRTNLGHVGSGDSEILQSVDTGSPGIFNMALWNRPDGPMLYLHTINSGVTAYRLTGGKFTPAPVAQSLAGFNMPYQGMAISANGATPGSGILWVLAPAADTLPVHAILHAYNAEDLSEIWNSDLTATDALGAFTKFANPTVVNGRVYVPTSGNWLEVYGALPTATSGANPVVTGILNAASYTEGPLAGGEIVELAGQNLGPKDVVVGTPDQAGILANQLSGTQVTFNGIPAPIVYTSADSVSAIVPFEVAGASTIVVQESWNGHSSAPISLSGAGASPGVFSADSSGSGPGAILNEDGTLNSPGNPAHRGATVIVYATGGGQTIPAAETGAVVLSSAPLAASVQATVEAEPAAVLYAGSAPGEVAGTVELKLQLPGDISGSAQLVISIGGQQSPATVTVSMD